MFRLEQISGVATTVRFLVAAARFRILTLNAQVTARLPVRFVVLFIGENESMLQATRLRAHAVTSTVAIAYATRGIDR